MNSMELLEKLVAFPTVSRDGNRDLINFVAGFLTQHGIKPIVLPDATGMKANLYATVGPSAGSGVLLSGHTDVVPVDGQPWTFPPFALTEHSGRLYGRGTTDMKAFVACALNIMVTAAHSNLTCPLHLALSYDEEVGCLGVHGLISAIKSALSPPRFIIVGEPTEMAVATGHKGKAEFRVLCNGREAHSALAPTGLNAIYLATDFIDAVRQKQSELETHGYRDGAFAVPYSTLHVGLIAAGTALNIVPHRCELELEIRNLATEDYVDILSDISNEARKIVTKARRIVPEADIEIVETLSFPGLDTPPESPIVNFVEGLGDVRKKIKVAYGTEGGLFSTGLGVPTVICGPGSMSQGHKADEFITIEQISRCDAMMGNLLKRLETGF